MTTVLNQAGVHGSTWTRIKGGAEPLMSTIDKLDRAIDELVAEDGNPTDGA